MSKQGNRNAGSVLADETDPPWFSWEIEDLADRFILFAETYLVTTKGFRFGQPIKIAQWQKDWCRSVLSADITAGVVTLPRGAGKSTFAGALAVWMIHDPAFAAAFGGQAIVPVICPTLKQGREGTYGAAVSFVKANPVLHNRTLIYTANGNEHMIVPGNYDSRVLLLAADEDNLQGLDPACVLLDEVGFIPTGVLEAAQLAAGKRPRNLILGLGTRSPGMTDNALDHLLAQLKLHGSLKRFHLTDFSAPMDLPIDSPETWSIANPAIAEGYLNVEEYESALERSGPERFRVYRLNQKVESLGGWLGPTGATRWDEAISDYEFDVTQPVFLGVDKSSKDDTSAVVSLQRTPQGKWFATSKVFVPKVGSDGTVGIDHKAVKDHIREMCTTYNVLAVGYDPRFMVEGAQELSDEGIMMIEVPQTRERLGPVFVEMYRLIQSREILHPDDLTFKQHVVSAVAKDNADGTFMLWKGSKENKATKIDSVVALSIALYTALGETPDPDAFWIA